MYVLKAKQKHGYVIHVFVASYFVITITTLFLLLFIISIILITIILIIICYYGLGSAIVPNVLENHEMVNRNRICVCIRTTIWMPKYKNTKNMFSFSSTLNQSNSFIIIIVIIIAIGI